MNATGFPWTHDAVASKQPEARVLIVADGAIDFCETQFGLTELIKVLLDADHPWDRVALTTAHRSENPCKGAHIPAFKFDTPPKTRHPQFSIENYDQVWLFGYEHKELALSDSELDCIIAFMQAGGGVFATGDHESMGLMLCGRIPRVRSMRFWEHPPAPDRDDATRIDTLRQGSKLGFQSTDQSDGTPQEIRPKFFLDEDKKNSHPHQLLKYGSFAVTVLPDHMHEGACREPTPCELENQQEYPRSPDGSQVVPEVVAISTSAGGFVLDEFVHPVEPKSFIVIAAYDGHAVIPPVGRIAVDSSFHHFVNLNLNGTGSPGFTGFFDKYGNPTSDYMAIRQYFRNIVSWLQPPQKKIDYYLNALVGLRYMSPLIEEVTKSSPLTRRESLFIGTATFNSMAERLSTTDATICAMALVELLPDVESRLITRKKIDPWQVKSLRTANELSLPIDTTLFVKIILGSAMIALANNLPDDPCEGGEGFAELQRSDRSLSSIVSQGVAFGFEVLKPLMESTLMKSELHQPNSAIANLTKGEKVMSSHCAGRWKTHRKRGGEVVAFDTVVVNDDGRTGTHLQSGDEVLVTCTADSMTWERPRTFYTGRLFDGGNEVSGTWSGDLESEAVKGSRETLDGDEWEGTKTGT